MTINEIAYNLLNLIRGGKTHHDEDISLEQLKFNIKYYRAMFIRRDFAKNGVVTRHIEQDLGCVNLQYIDGSKCCGLEVGSSVYRTVDPLPRTIRFNFTEALTYVGDVTGTKTIPLVNPNTLPYVYNAEGLEFINVRGVFENPEEVSRYGDCSKGECYDPSKDPFPISMDMLTLINQGITAGELTLLAGTYSDTVNDRMQDPQSKGGGSIPSSQEQTKQ